MDYFTLMRAFWDFAFENPEKIKPNHCALYAFIVEQNNRLGWKKKFGLPTTMAKDAIGIRSYNTYSKTLEDLVSFGLIVLIEKSKNQYSSNIVALSKFNNAPDKALDKALIKHGTKQSESTVQSIDSIDKQDTNIPIYNKQILSNNHSFSKSLLETFTWVEAICRQNKITESEVTKWIDRFNLKLDAELDIKVNKTDYASHFTRWVGTEIKNGKINTSGQAPVFSNR